MDKDCAEKKEITRGLDGLNASVNELLKRIKTLEERLSEVMKPIDSGALSETAKIAREILSPMGQRIQGITATIDDGIDTVETIMRRLAV